MKKSSKSITRIKKSSIWVKGAIGLIGLGLLLGAFILLTTEPGRSPTPAAFESRTPTSIATATLIPSPALTPPPTVTPSNTPIPSPGVTPTLGPVVIAQPANPVSPTIQASNAITGPATAIPVYTYKIIHTYPHDPNAFTQGLIFEDGVLYEGTGRRGQSTLRKVDLESGEILQGLQLPPELFGEGVTSFDDRLIQLTWQEHIGFVYDKASFELQQVFNYPTEGWGITHDGQRLIMSDGSATLYFWDPETLAEIGRIDVYDDNGPVMRLNELEYIQGQIYANVWQTDRIARIEPETGRVVGWIDLAGLLGPADRSQPVDVLNGIAYDAENDRLFVTGKLWPKLFEIKLIPVE